jgi:hypothetical protein
LLNVLGRVLLAALRFSAIKGPEEKKKLLPIVRLEYSRFLDVVVSEISSHHFVC